MWYRAHVGAEIGALNSGMQAGQGSLGPRLEIAVRGLGGHRVTVHLYSRGVPSRIEIRATLDSRVPEGLMFSLSHESGHCLTRLSQTRLGRRELQPEGLEPGALPYPAHPQHVLLLERGPWGRC